MYVLFGFGMEPHIPTLFMMIMMMSPAKMMLTITNLKVSAYDYYNEHSTSYD